MAADQRKIRLGLFGRLWLSAGLIIFAIAAITIAEAVAASEAQRANALESQNRAVVRATTSVLDDLQDAETGQRGYLLTRDEAYLEPFVKGRARARSDLTNLIAATTLAGSADLVGELVPVVRDKLAILDRTIALERHGEHREAMSIVLSGRGKATMDQARSIIKQINAGEARLRDERQATLTNLQTRTLWLLIFGGTALGGFVLAVTWSSVRRFRTSISWLRASLRDIREARPPDTGSRITLDELAPIAAEFDDLAHRLIEERERRTQTEDELRRRNDDLAVQQAAEQHRADTLDVVRKLSNRVSGCVTEAEFSDVIEHMLPPALNGSPGALFVLSNSRRILTPMTQWDQPVGIAESFVPNDCWALRRGRPHHVRDTARDVVCPHVHGAVRAYSCTPLSAQGETLGLLYAETAPADDLRSDDDLLVLSEMLAITLSNVRLRESLQAASLRDPLTGLFNRRYLHEAWELESARSLRDGRPIALLMLDIDHFKRFNDSYGHDAGDQVLKQVAAVLEGGTRAGDVVCRYGGEEFIVILIDANDENALARAETLRLAVKGLTLAYGPQRLGLITMSIGVATFPLVGTTFETVQRAADVALYQAKNNGRDRVEVAAVAANPA